MIEQLRQTKFTEREIDGVGAVRVKHIKSKEMFGFDTKDERTFINQLVSTCIYVGESPLCAKADDVDEIDWPVVETLAKAAQEINKLDRKAAEKKSDPPPSST